MFKTQVEQRAAGEWFHCKVLSILTSFLLSIRVKTIEIVVDLFFTITLTIFVVHFRWLFAENCGKEKKNCATITSFPWSVLTVLLSTLALDQSAGEKSLSCYKNSHFLRFRRFRRFHGFTASAVPRSAVLSWFFLCYHVTKVTSDLAPIFKVRVLTRWKRQPRLSPALTGFYTKSK